MGSPIYILSRVQFGPDDANDPHGLCLLATSGPNNNAELKSRIASLVGEDVWVTSPQAEANVAKIRKLFDTSCTRGAFNVLHNLVGQLGSDNTGMLKLLLGLGVDPDAETVFEWTPAHLAAWWVRPESAKILADVRPNVKALTAEDKKPVDCALSGYAGGKSVERERKQIAVIWVSPTLSNKPPIVSFGNLPFDEATPKTQW